MREPSPNDDLTDRRSTFLQEIGHCPRLVRWLWLLALAIVIAVALYTGSWVNGFLIGLGLSIFIGVLYKITAPIFGWPKLPWMTFIGEIIDLASWCR